ncbi:integrase [Escherichia coli]|nr:integrase [Escherichia coli]
MVSCSSSGISPNLRRCNNAVTNGAIVIYTQRLKSDPGGNLLS